MVREIKQFISDSGSKHDTKLEAHRDDLAHSLLTATGTVQNAALASAVASYITDNIHKLMPTFEGIMDETPLQPTAIAPAPEMSPIPVYWTPGDGAIYARCMGGDRCNHLERTCTADPDYQRWIKAETAFNSRQRMPGDPSNLPLSEQTFSVQQGWLHKAETGEI